MTMGYIEAPVDPPDYWVCEECAIDKGVPLPSRRFDEGHPLAVLKKMEVEDSVFFRGVTSGSRAYEVLQNRMSRLKKNKGWVLVSRSRIEDGDKGVRVWRRA